MNVTAYPTEVLPTIVNYKGQVVEAREWKGVTSSGEEVILLVVNIVPMDQTDAGVARLGRELPAYFGGEKPFKLLGGQS